MRQSLGAILLTLFVSRSLARRLGDIDDHPPRDFNEGFRTPKPQGPEILFADGVETKQEIAQMIQPRIIGGEDANPDQNSFFTMLLKEKDGQYINAGCGGSHITNCHVLTAAHCVSNNRAGLTNAVMVHAWKPYEKNGGAKYHFTAVSSASAQIKVHPKYVADTNEYDVAIIRLDKCADIEDFPPIELAKPGHIETLTDGDELRSMGFGRLSENEKSTQATLQSAVLPYISREVCDDWYSTSVVSEDMFCAGYEDGGVDTCIGDSGGPLVQEINGRSTQVGICSWGIGCARRKLPGVYSSISTSYEWIVDSVCSDTEVVSEMCISPSLPGTCDSVGEPCDKDEDCCTGFCKSEYGKPLCARRSQKPRPHKSKKRISPQNMPWDDNRTRLRNR